MNQTAVEFLAEKYNHITWMRNRDEISAVTADELRTKFLKESKEIEKAQIINAYKISTSQFANESEIVNPKTAEEYYNETFKSVFDDNKALEICKLCSGDGWVFHSKGGQSGLTKNCPNCNEKL